jgi:hypothetical protein
LLAVAVQDKGVIDDEQPEDVVDDERPAGVVDDERPATDERPADVVDDVGPAGAEQPEEPEVVDGVLVLSSARAIEPRRESAPALRSVAAVAATGFVAGAATAAVLGRSLARRQARRAGAGVGAATAPPQRDVLDVVVSRHFVVHVHTLARR